MSDGGLSLTEYAIPFFGARRYARALLGELDKLAAELASSQHRTKELTSIAQDLLRDAKEIQAENATLKEQLARLGLLSTIELNDQKNQLEEKLVTLRAQVDFERTSIAEDRATINKQLEDACAKIVETDDIALLQEVGIYEYRHPLKDVVAYQGALKRLEGCIKAAAKSDGAAVQAATNWTVNGSKSEGEQMTRDMSKLMLHALNVEADGIIRGLKPYKRDAGIKRLRKVAETIQKLGKGMQIEITPAYLQLRIDEIELTSDYLQKQAEQKEADRVQRERLRDEKKAQQENAEERAKLEKECAHFESAMAVLIEKGDIEAVERVREQLIVVSQAIADVNFRATQTRAGFVYVISNIGSFGEGVIKVGMTRRRDAGERIRELSDASVPFNFDTHAIFFSADAVSLESAMHERLESYRVNKVNCRREFFKVSVAEAKRHLAELAGELLEFNEFPEAEEFRQTLRLGQVENPASLAA